MDYLNFMKLQQTKEILDLVDENDQVIGIIERGEAYQQGLTNIRVIDAFIKNAEGKLFIPRRHKDKRLHPLKLDASAGGHVSSGESYDEAFVKEVQEELNLDVRHVLFKKLGTMTPESDGTGAFITVYEILSDETPDYNPNDFIEHYWLTPEEIIERIAQGDKAKSHLPMILKKFYL